MRFNEFHSHQQVYMFIIVIVFLHQYLLLRSYDFGVVLEFQETMPTALQEIKFLPQIQFLLLLLRLDIAGTRIPNHSYLTQLL